MSGGSRAFRILRVVSTLLCVVTAAGCAAGPNPAAPAAGARQFVGQTSDPNVFVGIVTDGQSAQAYYCDGTNGVVQRSGWLTGKSTGDTLDLTSPKGARLGGQVASTAVQGTLTLVDGTALTFTAAPATGVAGLYRADGMAGDQKYVAGWIVLPDGQQRGALTLGTNEPVALQPLSASMSEAQLPGIGIAPLRRMVTATMGLTP